MSKSRSSSPIRTPPPVNTVSTTLRPQRQSPSTTERREPLLVVRLPSPSPPLPLEQEIPASEPSSRRRLRQPEDSTEEPMAKRIRRESPQRLDSHSSQESDSQDDLADNEMEATTPHASKEPQQPAAPPKKKRTRTLTTPHQSAVLHALLAQSRFPTTAMREEVGRSIGLSARKVQIWFQNQRQKARRPRSTSDAPTSKLPQYGPFPGAGEPSMLGRGYDEHGEHMHYAAPMDPQGGPSELSGRLLGPGMPGTYPTQGFRQVLPAPTSASPTESRFLMGHLQDRPPSPHGYHRSPRLLPPSSSRPLTSQPISWRERDPSRTLPPLQPPRPSSSTVSSRRIHSSGPHAYPQLPPFIPTRSTSPEQRFAHQLPEPISRHSMNIPPPFTLQPPPQWDESSYLPRPSSSSWSSRPGSHSTRGRSISPITLRRDPIMSAAEASGSDLYYQSERTSHVPSSPRSLPPASTPPLRSGRYDPIRATFVPYSTPSPVPSPLRADQGADDDDRDRSTAAPHKDR